MLEEKRPCGAHPTVTVVASSHTISTAPTPQGNQSPLKLTGVSILVQQPPYELECSSGCLQMQKKIHRFAMAFGTKPKTVIEIYMHLFFLKTHCHQESNV